MYPHSVKEKDVIIPQTLAGIELKKMNADSTLTFYGTRLPDNAVDKSGKGNMWVQTAYDYGYADSHPNDSISRCSFDIAWAVTAEGEHVNLPCADFVRVYTGVHQQCGWIGEISTEISHARDLNIEK